jgi:hypothetical protein
MMIEIDLIRIGVPEQMLGEGRHWKGCGFAARWFGVSVAAVPRGGSVAALRLGV